MNDEFVWLYLTESTPEEPLAACVAYPGRGVPLPYIAARTLLMLFLSKALLKVTPA